MKRIIVTGGSGFLGQVTMALLKQAFDGSVINLDIKNPSKKEDNFVFQDIRNPLDFVFLPDDVVVHLAATQYHEKVPRKNKSAYFSDTNLQGTNNILQKMQRDGAHQMIFFSTDMVYGLPREVPLKESHPCVPFGPYGESKKNAENLCAEFREKGFNITIFRPRLIVGSGRYGILTKLFKAMQYNLPIPMIGSGSNCYQMVSVGDCAQATLLALQKNIPNQQYNLGSANPPPIKTLLRKVINRAGSSSILIPTWAPSVKATLAMLGMFGLDIMYKEQYLIADQNYVLDITTAVTELEWKPLYSDEDMLFAAYQEYRDKHRNIYV